MNKPLPAARARAGRCGIATCALLAALLAAGCAGQRETTQDEAAKQCKMYRGYLQTQGFSDVMAACTRQLGEAYCRQCLQ
jgi:hypothetical protein